MLTPCATVPGSIHFCCRLRQPGKQEPTGAFGMRGKDNEEMAGGRSRGRGRLGGGKKEKRTSHAGLTNCNLRLPKQLQAKCCRCFHIGPPGIEAGRAFLAREDS